MNHMSKQSISRNRVITSVGFIYWLQETHDLRGLKGTSIEAMGSKIKELQDLYNKKYPDGLIGWNE